MSDQRREIPDSPPSRLLRTPPLGDDHLNARTTDLWEDDEMEVLELNAPNDSFGPSQVCQEEIPAFEKVEVREWTRTVAKPNPEKVQNRQDKSHSDVEELGDTSLPESSSTCFKCYKQGHIRKNCLYADPQNITEEVTKEIELNKKLYKISNKDIVKSRRNWKNKNYIRNKKLKSLQQNQVKSHFTSQNGRHGGGPYFSGGKV